MEERNLADKLPDVVQKMENTLSEIQDQKFSNYEKSDEIDGEETLRIEKELRKLGYIDQQVLKQYFFKKIIEKTEIKF